MFRARIEGGLDAEKFNLRVSGSCPELGAWDPQKAVPMTPNGDGSFTASVEMSAAGPQHQVCYKYALYEGDRLRKFEALDSNRVFAGTADDTVSLHSMVMASLRDEVEVFVREATCSRSDCTVKDIRLVNSGDDQEWLLSVGLGASVRVPAASLKDPSIVVRVADTQGKCGAGIVGSDHIRSKKRCHKTHVPILSESFREMCVVSLSCLFVEPMAEGVKEELAVLRGSRPAFSQFIGHRGSGSTRKDGPKDAVLTENTLVGFVSASDIAASEGVEFDVHLTADCVPVVYHDVTYPVRTADGTSVFDVPINHMAAKDAAALRPKLMDENRGPAPTCDECGVLHSKTSHSHKQQQKKKSAGQQPSSSFWERADHVPLFKELFDYVPEKTGFDVEIKYFDNAKLESKYNPFERNFYVDTIVGLVLRRTEPPSKRWLFYSSFDFDVCVLASRKQSRHDVLLLSIGDSRYCSPDCNRVCPLEEAIDAAHAVGLRGVVTDSKNALANPHLVEKAHGYEMVLLTYGALK